MAIVACYISVTGDNGTIMGEFWDNLYIIPNEWDPGWRIILLGSRTKTLCILKARMNESGDHKISICLRKNVSNACLLAYSGLIYKKEWIKKHD